MLSRIFHAARTVIQGLEIGALVDETLDRFAAWACTKYPGSQSAAQATGGSGFRAYVITDHDGDPYITRILFPRVFGFRPMLHHIHRPDFERALHNHPWPWAFSLVLRGSYTEERLCEHEHGCEDEIKRRVRWFNFLRGSSYHRITELHGNVWTLFVTGEREPGASWGFREWNSAYEDYTTTPNELYLHRQRYEREHGFESWSLDAWAADVGCEPRQPIVRRWESREVTGEWCECEDVETDPEFTSRILAHVRNKR